MLSRMIPVFAMSLLLSACTSMTPVVKRGNIPPAEDIAVIGLRDCLIKDQSECNGSGSIAASILARVFSTVGGYSSVPLSRPISSKATLTDDEAVKFAASKNFKFVVNGEVIDYYSVAPMTFRVDRAGISIRLIRVNDGSVLAFYSQQMDSKTNFDTPDNILENMAEHFVESLK